MDLLDFRSARAKATGAPRSAFRDLQQVLIVNALPNDGRIDPINRSNLEENRPPDYFRKAGAKPTFSLFIAIAVTKRCDGARNSKRVEYTRILKIRDERNCLCNP